jgi:hypothetical protein
VVFEGITLKLCSFEIINFMGLEIVIMAFGWFSGSKPDLSPPQPSPQTSEALKSMSFD